MAINFLSAGTASTTASGTSLTVAKHGAALYGANTFFVVVVAVRGSAFPVTATPGWTRISRLVETNGGVAVTMAIFTASTSAAAINITWGSAFPARAIGLLMDGGFNSVDVGAAIEGQSSSNSGIANPHIANGGPVTRGGSILLYADAAAATTALATPSGWTQAAAGSNNALSLTLGYKEAPSSGSFSGISANGAASPNPWVLYLVELRIAVPATGLQVADLEQTTVLHSGIGLSVADLEQTTVLHSGIGLSVADLEYVVVLSGDPSSRRPRRGMFVVNQ